MSMKTRTKNGRLIAVTTLIAVAGLGLAACDSGGGAEPVPSESTPTSEIDINAEYAPGVPTLAQMFEGTGTEPPSSAPKPEAGKTIYFMTCSSAIPACLDPAEAAKEAGEKVGWTVNIIDGKFDEGGAFAAGIRSAIAANADGIMMYGISCAQSIQALREAKDAGIPVLGMSGLDCDESGDGESLWSVKMMASEAVPDMSVEYSADMARNSAHYIINATGGQAKLLMTHGTVPQLASAQEAFLEEFAKCADCEVIADVPYELSDLAPNGPWIQAWRQALIEYGDSINAAYPEWDGHMLNSGGLQAVQEAGLGDKVITFGGEGVAGTYDAIRNGSLTALTKVHSSGWIGYGAIDSMNRYFHDEPQVPQGIGIVVVDKDHNLPPEGETYDPEFDYRAAYEMIWEEGTG